MDGLALGAAADGFLEGRRGREIDLCSEEAAELEPEAAEGEQEDASARGEVGEEVDVRAGGGFVAGDGAEETQVEETGGTELGGVVTERGEDEFAGRHRSGEVVLLPYEYFVVRSVASPSASLGPSAERMRLRRGVYPGLRPGLVWGGPLALGAVGFGGFGWNPANPLGGERWGTRFGALRRHGPPTYKLESRAK